MTDLSIQLCRAARGLLGWSQIDLAAKSGISRATIAAFESGVTAPAARTLRDLVAAFEAAGVLFIDPAEGVHQGAVALKWEAQVSQRPSGAETEASERSQRGNLAITWDDGIDALHEELAPAANLEIEELRAYWRANPEKWAAMHKSTRWALLNEMRLREL